VRGEDKPIAWLHGEIKTPPVSAPARLEAGILLRRLQRGERLSMPHSRPMPAIGARCHELRINDEDVTWRVFYRVDPDAIVIAEVTTKKTARTPQSDDRHLPTQASTLRPGDGGPRLMRAEKRRRLAAEGWRVAGTQEFLSLAPEEAALVEIRLKLADGVRELRKQRRLTQAELARRLGSSQSRVAKVETADESVSLDLLIRSFLAMGATAGDLAKVISAAQRSHAL